MNFIKIQPHIEELAMKKLFLFFIVLSVDAAHDETA